MHIRSLAVLAGGLAVAALAMPAHAQFTETTYADLAGLGSGQMVNLARADASIAGGAVLGGQVVGLINWGDFGSGNVNDGNIPANLQVPGVLGADDYVSDTVGNFTVTGAGGNFTFIGNSDDGQRLVVDGNPVFVDDNLHGPQNAAGTVFLAPGLHSLDYTWFERGGGAEGDLVYSVAGLPFTPVLTTLVPEPASLGVIALGALGVLARRRRA